MKAEFRGQWVGWAVPTVSMVVGRAHPTRLRAGRRVYSGISGFWPHFGSNSVPDAFFESANA
jgi:hypothetical protein